MHILLAAAEIRTHSLQNYEFEQTCAFATAATTSYSKFSSNIALLTAYQMCAKFKRSGARKRKDLEALC